MQRPQRITDDIHRRLSAALAHHQRGEFARARQLYGEVLQRNPRCFDALHLLGVATVDGGGLDAGIDLIRRAIALDPSQANAHYSLARALMMKGDSVSALSCLSQATALQPNDADAWLLRGNVLQQTARLEESVASYRRAIEIRPGFPEAFNNLSAALRSLRHTAAALECAERALSLQPHYPKALNNRGLGLLDCHRGEEAVASFRQAVALDVKFAEAHHNLGIALMQLRRFVEARGAFTHLALIAPTFSHVRGNLLHAKLSCCDWTDIDREIDAVSQAVARGEQADVPTSFLCVSGSPQLQLRCAQTYTDTYFPARPPMAATDSAHPHDRIRVAYLSGDFGEHAVSHLLAGVFESHDTAQFEAIALSWDRRNGGDAMRTRVETAFSRFIDVTDAADADVARLIRELKIDIAVDLSGHTRGHRTGILSYQAAPIQVNYLGLPATMGARYMDYIIADRCLVPDECRSQFTERVVWLPESFQPHDNRRGTVPESVTRAEHGLPETGFIFCSFNGNFKFNPTCFDVWIRILNGVPGSVLWLLASTEEAERNLRREALKRGADASRLVFAAQVAHGEYLARYRVADLLLDSSPYNGGTTVSDALSMGLPVLTCAGESFAARMASSLLIGLGLAELVTESLTDYEAVALELAMNPARLTRLRRQLTESRRTHHFFDTERYTRHLESAYRTMWERHAAGLEPASFAVAPIDDARG